MNQINSILVDWNEGNGNTPQFVITVDNVAPEDAWRYHETKTPSGTLYYATVGHLVRFMFHNPSHEHGYGGATFTLTMHGTGEVRKVKGPWSSNSKTVNTLTGLQCTECELRLPTGEEVSAAALDWALIDACMQANTPIGRDALGYLQAFDMNGKSKATHQMDELIWHPAQYA